MTKNHEAHTDPIWVLFADSEGLCREGLQRLLEQSDRVALAGVTAQPDRLHDEVRRVSPTLLLLGDELPGVQDGRLFEKLRKVRPACRSLVLTRLRTPRYVRHLLDGGAGGVFHRGDSFPDLLRALGAISAGQLHLSPTLAGSCVMHLSSSPGHEPLDTLSRREFETILLLARGNRVKEVARQMDLSVRTVSTYRLRAFEKLQVGSLPELGRYAMDAGLLAPSDTYYVVPPRVRQTGRCAGGRVAGSRNEQ